MGSISRPERGEAPTDRAASFEDPSRDSGSASVPVKPTITRRGIGGVGVASIIAGISGLIVMVVVAATLSPAQNAEFLLFWSLLFWIFGTLGGIQYETVRSVRGHYSSESPEPDVTVPDSPSATDVASRSSRASFVRVLPAALAIGAVISLTLLAASWWWGPLIFSHDPYFTAVVIAIAAFLFAGHSSLVGSLSGRGWWGTNAALISGEALVRLACIIAVIGLGLTRILPFEVAATAGCVVWLVALASSPKARSAARSRGDVPTGEFVGLTVKSMVAGAASSTLLVGFTTLLSLTTASEVYESSAGLIFAISMTRAPLLMPLTAFQGVVIAHFVTAQHRGLRVILKAGAAIFGFGIIVGIAAAIVGPPLLGLLGSDYRIAGLTLGALTMAAAMLALLTLTGTMTLAIKRHTAYLTGWVVATAVSIGVLCLPWSIDARAIAALLIGPAVGILIHIIAIVRTTRSAPHVSVAAETLDHS